MKNFFMDLRWTGRVEEKFKNCIMMAYGEKGEK